MACTNKFQLNVFSCAWTATLNASDLPTTNNSTWIYTCRHVANSTGFHVGVRQPSENGSPYMWLQFYYYDSTNTNHYISKNFVADCYDGKPHTYAVIFNGSLIKFLIDNELKSSATLDYDFVPRDCSYPLTIGAITHKISRIKYFNFDMSADDAPYTIADYISGKDESPLLKLRVQSYNTSGMIFSSVNQTTYPCDIVSDSATDSITITTTGEIASEYTWIDGRANAIAIPQGANVEVSVGDLDVATSVQCYFYSGATRVQTLTGVSNDNPTISFVAPANLTRLSLIIHAGVNPIPTGTALTITGLKIKVNGALLSLDDYSIEGKVLDISGNNNHATITGAVYGSKSSSVETFVETVIGNSTDNSDKIQVSDDGIKLIGATTIVDSDDITYFEVTPDDAGGYINANAEMVYIKSAGVNLISGETGALYIGDESSPSVMAIYTPAGTWSYDNINSRDIFQFNGTDISRFKINTFEIENICGNFNVQAGQNVKLISNVFNIQSTDEDYPSLGIKLNADENNLVNIIGSTIDITGDTTVYGSLMTYESPGIYLNGEYGSEETTHFALSPDKGIELKTIGNDSDSDVIKILTSSVNGEIVLGNNIYLGEEKNWNVSNNIDTLDFNYNGTSVLTLNDSGQVDCKSIALSNKSGNINNYISGEGMMIDIDGAYIISFNKDGVGLNNGAAITFDYDTRIDSVLSNFEYGTDIDYNIVWDNALTDLTSESKVVSEKSIRNIVEPLIARIKELESAVSSTDPVDQIKLKINGTDEYCIVKAEKDETGAITLTLE